MLVAMVVAAWLLMGAVTGLVMARRGHDRFSWSFLTLVLGPLAIPLAVSAERHRPSDSRVPTRDGELDVLVALDGSASADAALDVALSVIGPSATSVTLVAVVDLEASTTVRGHETERAAHAFLDETARRVAPGIEAPVDTVLLHGSPARRLTEYASDCGYELIVAGGHGHLARQLAAGARVPVLLGPAPPGATPHSA